MPNFSESSRWTFNCSESSRVETLTVHPRDAGQESGEREMGNGDGDGDERVEVERWWGRREG
eukprot:786847-Rhodomonas_salina.1